MLKVCTHRQKLLAILGGQLVDEGRDHAAGAAPRRPKVNQNRHLGLEHLHLECRIRHHARVLGPCGEETQVMSGLRRRLISRDTVCTDHRAPVDGCCCCCCSAGSPPLPAQAAVKGISDTCSLSLPKAPCTDNPSLHSLGQLHPRGRSQGRGCMHHVLGHVLASTSALQDHAPSRYVHRESA